MKIKIQKLNITDKDKDGHPLNYNGKPYSKLSVQSPDGQWYSGYAGKWNSGWKVGDEIDVEVVDKEYNGRVYHNFKAPASARGADLSQFASTLQIINEKLDKVLAFIYAKDKTAALYDGVQTKEDDIPF